MIGKTGIYSNKLLVLLFLSLICIIILSKVGFNTFAFIPYLPSQQQAQNSTMSNSTIAKGSEPENGHRPCITQCPPGKFCAQVCKPT
jgi:hypothetical protein